MDIIIPPLRIKILLESDPLKSRISVRRLAEGGRARGLTMGRKKRSAPVCLEPVAKKPPATGAGVGRLSYGYLRVSCCLTRSSRISLEIHQNFARISPEFHRNFTRCHQNFTGQNIELEHLKTGDNLNSAFPQAPRGKKCGSAAGGASCAAPCQ